MTANGKGKSARVTEDCAMDRRLSLEASALGSWTPDQIADTRRWIEIWKLAVPELERIRRQELLRAE